MGSLFNVCPWGISYVCWGNPFYKSGDMHYHGSSFLQGTRLVYKHLATLYFVFVFDSCENELAMLDLIQGAKQVFNLLHEIVFIYKNCAFSTWVAQLVLAELISSNLSLWFANMSEGFVSNLDAVICSPCWDTGQMLQKCLWAWHCV